MKNRHVLLLCLAFFLTLNHGFAQLSKKEKKEWKKTAKRYAKNPANLKDFTEAKQTADAQVSALNAKVTQLQGTLSDRDAKIVQLEDEISQLRSQLTSTRAELAQLRENPPAQINPMDFSKGIVFKVQIGAFKNKDLSKYFENNPNFGGELIEEGGQRFTIGIFRDYWEADTFKKYMREMGVKDAWIVPYRDGQRVDIKDVLEGVVTDRPQGTN